MELSEFLDAIKQQAKKEEKTYEEIILERINVKLPKDFDIFYWLYFFYDIITQVNAVEGGIIGINYNSLDFVFNLYNFDNYQKYYAYRILKVFEKVYVEFNNKKISQKLEKSK